MQSRPWTMMQATGLDKDLLKIAGDGARPGSSVGGSTRRARDAEHMSTTPQRYPFCYASLTR